MGLDAKREVRLTLCHILKIAALLGVLAALLHVYRGSLYNAGMSGALVLIALFVERMLQRGASLPMTGHALCVLLLALNARDLTQPEALTMTSILIVIAPLATFTAGTRAGIGWMFVVLGYITFLTGLHQWLIPFDKLINFAFNSSGSMLIVAALSISYQRSVEAREQHLLEVHQTRASMLAAVSHELNTPLNGILGLADVIKTEPAQERRERLAEQIKDNGQVLLSIFEAILIVARDPDQDKPSKPEPTALRALSADALRLVRPAADRKGLPLELVVSEDLPEQMLVDSDRLRQVLTHLLSNAIKFTETGAVVLEVSGVPNGDQFCLQFAVEDTGIGISPEAQHNILQPFSQAESGTERRYEGLGLGLSISHRLLNAMGGTLTIDSIPGQGSTFTVTLSASPCKNCTPEGEETLPFFNRAALVVDDHPLNRMVCRHALESLGCSVDEAEDGVDALEQVDQHDFILMDYHMPRFDGARATVHLREMGYTNPIIGLTADRNPQAHRTCLEAGMNACLTKPLKTSSLSRTLRELLPAPVDNARSQSA